MESRSFEMMPNEAVHSMIAVRAYEIYQLRGGEPGREAEDWFLAEREILAGLSERPIAEDEKPRSRNTKRTRAPEKTPKASGTKKRKRPVDPSIL